jgi:hypothetical protein
MLHSGGCLVERFGWLARPLVDVAIGMGIVGLAWLVVSGTQGSSDPGGSHTAVGSRPGSNAAGGRGSVGTRQASSTRLARCVDAASAIAGPLRAARASVDQWEVHVGAMNKLVLGQISLQQAGAFWAQTRIDAYQRIDHFEKAASRLRQRGVDCPAPSLLPKSAPVAVRQCSRQVAADLQALKAAGTAIDTWHNHVHAMDMLRMGKLSPSMAEQMWLSMWQRGQQEIQAYRAALHDAHAMHGCTAQSG